MPRREEVIVQFRVCVCVSLNSNLYAIRIWHMENTIKCNVLLFPLYFHVLVNASIGHCSVS